MADYIGEATALSSSVQKARIGQEIIAQTLDKVNSYGKGQKSTNGDKMSQTYQFNRDVLDAVYSDKGSIANGNG